MTKSKLLLVPVFALLGQSCQSRREVVSRERPLFLYQVFREIIAGEKEPITPEALRTYKGGYRRALPPNSISTVTEINLAPSQKGII